MRILMALVLMSLASVAQAWIHVDRTWVSFHSVPLNDSFGREERIRVSNDGPDAVSVHVSDTCSFDFNVRDQFCWSLAPMQSCTVEIRFRPSRPGRQSCTVRISDSMGDSETVWVDGTGVGNY